MITIMIIIKLKINVDLCTVLCVRIVNMLSISTDYSQFNFYRFVTKQIPFGSVLSVDICALQETKVSEKSDEQIADYRLILLPGKCRHYGLGFAMNKFWTNSIVEHDKRPNSRSNIRTLNEGHKRLRTNASESKRLH